MAQVTPRPRIRIAQMAALIVILLEYKLKQARIWLNRAIGHPAHFAYNCE